MSLKFRDSSGNETPIAGLNGQNGSLFPSVSLYQSGSGETGNVSGSSYTDISITFQTPMPDTDYVINFNIESGGNYNFLVSNIFSKTVNGFAARIRNLDPSTAYSGSYKWQAFKLMTDQVHEADAAAIQQNTNNFANAFSTSVSYAVGDYVTYNNVLYRCTTAHTAGVWVAGHFTAVTVGGDLTKDRTLGSKVTLDAYNSSSNQYTFPRDGYLYVFADSTNNNAITRFSLIAGGEAIDVKAIQSINSTSASQVLFVKKGMKGYVSQRTDSTYCHVWYYPAD